MKNGRPVSARVLVGSTGRGKTRLALELAEQASAAGWQAGFITSAELKRFRAQQNLADWGWQKPVLAVVDYAAGDAELLQPWLVELADSAARSDAAAGRDRPLRLLLLERQADVAGGWWRTAFGRGGGDARAAQGLLEPAEPVTLGVIERAEDRRAMIAGILEAAGSKVRPPAAGQARDFDRDLAALTWGGEPLFLMMAGLRVAEVNFGAVLALSRDELAFSIADRELDRIARVAAAHKVPRELAEHMAAVVTVSAGLGRVEALAAIDREKTALRRQSAGDDATILAALSDALSHDEDGDLDPVQPDMVAVPSIICLTGSTPWVSKRRRWRRSRKRLRSTVRSPPGSRTPLALT
jgi:hypothetical protein